MKKRYFILYVLLLAAVIFIAYFPAIKSPFQFDDEAGIVMNPAFWDIRALGAVLTYKTELPRPLFNLSLAIDYAIWGMSPTGYHLTNLAIHLLCAILVWRLASRLFSILRIARAETASMLAGFIFALDPAASETVIYIWSRSTGMTSLFLLASLVMWIDGVEPVKTRRLIAAFVFYLLALASKEEAVFFPALLVALDLSLFGPENRKKRLLYTVPFWVLPLGVAAFRAAMGKGGVDFVSWRAGMGDDLARMAHERGLTGLIPMNFYTQSKVGLEYLRIMLWPFGLSIDHGVNLEMGFPSVLAVVGMIAVFGAGAFFVLFRKRFPLAVFLCAFFILPILIFYFTPVTDMMVERRMYLPLAAFAIALAAMFVKVRPKHGAVLSVTTLILFASLSFARAELWRDKIVLWADAVRVSPLKQRPRTTLARYYDEAGMTDRALSQNLTMLQIKPDCPSALRNLGLIYLRKGELVPAEQYFKDAIKLHPRADSNAYYNLGVVYEEMGRGSDAEANYNRALKINKDMADAHVKLGLIAATDHNDLTGALVHFRAALKIDPGLVEARMNLGNALVDSGQVMGGLTELEKAAQSAPDNPMVMFNLGMTYLQIGRVSEAQNLLVAFLRTARSNNDPKMNPMIEQAVEALQSIKANRRPF